MCGYNLRSLSCDAICPSATPVSQSFVNNALAYSDPKWLKLIVVGIEITTLAAIGCVVAGAILISQPVFFESLPPIVKDLLRPVLLTIVSMGALLFTTRARESFPGQRDLHSRSICRATAVSWLAMNVAWGLFDVAGQSPTIPIGISNGIMEVCIRLAYGCVSITFLLSTLRHLTHLARRSATPKLKGVGDWLFWSSSILVGLIVLNSFMGQIGFGSSIFYGGAFCAGIFMFFALPLAILVFGIALSLAVREDLNKAIDLLEGVADVNATSTSVPTDEKD
ncbi:MAG: hypothetical protein IPK83_07690 [Planctomycetes bacterium]|nr:hypothetical protein [Planctomycetota bacterium]